MLHFVQHDIKSENGIALEIFQANHRLCRWLGFVSRSKRLLLKISADHPKVVNVQGWSDSAFSVYCHFERIRAFLPCLLSSLPPAFPFRWKTCTASFNMTNFKGREGKTWVTEQVSCFRVFHLCLFTVILKREALKTFQQSGESKQ